MFISGRQLLFAFLALLAVVVLAVILVTDRTNDVVLWIAFGGLAIAAVVVFRFRGASVDGFGISGDLTDEMGDVPVRRQTSVRHDSRYVFEVDGERREYDSLDDVPEELRAMLEKARGPGGRQQKIVININGEERTYDSLDDVPEEHRAMLKRLRGD